MKAHLIILSIAITLTAISCKSKKETASSNTTSKEAVAETPKASGKVSHKYKASGCSSVVIVSSSEGEITLIPKDNLPSDLDKDGTEIQFNYITLKMPQPAGCTTGIPASLTDISKK